MDAKTNLSAKKTVTREVIPGIVKDAERLGVSRYHLWAVLSGRRWSPGLVARYNELKSVKLGA